MFRKQLARSFGPVAEAYDRGRPGYPADAVRMSGEGDEPNAFAEDVAEIVCDVQGQAGLADAAGTDQRQ